MKSGGGGGLRSGGVESNCEKLRENCGKVVGNCDTVSRAPSYITFLPTTRHCSLFPFPLNRWGSQKIAGNCGKLRKIEENCEKLGKIAKVRKIAGNWRPQSPPLEVLLLTAEAFGCRVFGRQEHAPWGKSSLWCHTCGMLQSLSWSCGSAWGMAVQAPSPLKRQPWYAHSSVPSSSMRPSLKGARRWGHLSAKTHHCSAFLSHQITTS